MKAAWEAAEPGRAAKVFCFDNNFNVIAFSALIYFISRPKHDI